MEPSGALKLTCELVPNSCWGRSLKNKLPRGKWDQIRNEVFKNAGHRCEICGGTGTLHCHEIWHYDEDKAMQTLTGLQALCEMCHAVKHMGRTSVAESGARKEAALAHFMRVNNVDRTIFDKHWESVKATWARRSEQNWTTDFGSYGDIASPIKPLIEQVGTLNWSKNSYRGRVEYRTIYIGYRLKVHNGPRGWSWELEMPDKSETIVGLGSATREEAMAEAKEQADMFGK